MTSTYVHEVWGSPWDGGRSDQNSEMADLSASAHSQGAGEEYDFVIPLKNDYVCSVCLELLREPHLTSCCGQHFCKTCLENVLGRGMKCPLCNQDFAAIIDRRIQREIRSLQVRCSYKAEGCEWVGELGELKDHLDAQKGRCRFCKLVCPKGCGQTIHRSDLDHHLKSICPKRDRVCEYCGNLFSYDGINYHWGLCEKYPVACPNRCSEERFPRNTLVTHQQHCPLQIVDCEFASLGCTEKVQRKDVAQHMQDGTQRHLSMMSRLCVELTRGTQEKQKQAAQVTQQLQEKNREVATLRDMLTNLKVEFEGRLQQQRSAFEAKLRDQDQKLLQLQFQLEDPQRQAPLRMLQQRVQIMETLVSVPPYYFTLTNYSLHKRGTTQWMCPPFYTELGCYKMAIEISANGEGTGKNSHVSVYIRIMRGEYDDQLQWPLKASVTMQLISQWNEAHYEMTTPYYEWARVTDGVVGVGWGWDKFVSHREIEFNPATQAEYLKNDRLNFRVICVDRA